MTGIKPLEWVVDDDRICLAAYPIGLRYRIHQWDADKPFSLSTPSGSTKHDTEEEAKAAAQADFAARILSALAEKA